MNINEEIAEAILKQTLLWMNESSIANELKELRAIAQYKYDNYQNFSIGMRFLESFVIWLDQFNNDNDKKISYDFITSKLIYISRQEILHLVSLIYYKSILPVLIDIVADRNKKPKYLINQHISDPYFKILLRKCLFMGLSDGSMMGDFRRENKKNSISHEQICSIYYINRDKRLDLQKELKKGLLEIPVEENDLKLKREKKRNRFEVLFLLDDFTASGKSFIDKKKRRFKGKIAKSIKVIEKNKGFFQRKYLVVIVLCIATNKARRHIDKYMRELLKRKPNVEYRIEVLQILEDNITITDSEKIYDLILKDDYYDPAVQSEHTDKGGSQILKLGFAECAIPVILNHNTPNNSIFILWSYDYLKFKGLFPRITRHG